jgi:hypothetical protein
METQAKTQMIGGITVQPITKEHIRRLNALGGAAGLKERNNRNDDYHAVIYRLTSKSSTKDLTETEFIIVERELLYLLRLGARQPPPPTPRKNPNPEESTPPGMMSKDQIRKAWGKFYELKALDTTPSLASDRARMKAIIKRSLSIDTALSNDLFKWITVQQGHTLIEAIKGIVKNAKKEAGGE